MIGIVKKSNINVAGVQFKGRVNMFMLISMLVAVIDSVLSALMNLRNRIDVVSDNIPVYLISQVIQ